MKLRCIGLLVTLIMCASTARAGVVIGGTRLIYEGDKKEASLNVNNPERVPYLIQSWVEDGSGNVDSVPFVITPPLFRLDGEQRNILRVIYTGDDLPKDRESLFWLNVKSIPSAPKRDNTLQIAVKTRIKLIFRPNGLKSETPEDVTSQLQWKSQGKVLQVSNPTAYYMNFNSIMVNGVSVVDPTFVGPRSTAEFKLPSGGKPVGEVSWQIISDYGAIGKAHQTSL